MPVLTKEAKSLIDRPNFAHLATLMPDGSPQSVPVWVGREREHIVIAPEKIQGGKTRVAIRGWRCFTDPYEEVQIRGRVIERRPDPDLKIMGPISHKHTGKPFPFRNPEARVALIIEAMKGRYTKLPFHHTPPK